MTDFDSTQLKRIGDYLRSIDTSLGKLTDSLSRIADHYDEEKMNGVYTVVAPAIGRYECPSVFEKEPDGRTLIEKVQELKEEGITDERSIAAFLGYDSIARLRRDISEEHKKNKKKLATCLCGEEPKVMCKHYMDNTHKWWIECKACGRSTIHSGDFDMVLDDWDALVTL